MYKRISLIMNIVLLSNITIYAQEVDFRPNFVSPQSYNIIKYGNVPVNYANGESNVTIPLYKYKDNDFELPIILGYNSSGFMPNKREGIVGLDWFLNAGGVITRKVNGRPDDVIDESSSTIIGGLWCGIKANSTIASLSLQDIFSLNCGNNLSSIGGWDINGFEAEPDEFNFSFLGHSGSFFIQNNGKVQCTGNKYYKIDIDSLGIQVVSDESYSVEYSKIVITTDDGYKYYFGGDIKYLEVSYGIGANERQTTVVKKKPTIVAWHLSQIIAPNGRKVFFQYNNFFDGNNETPIYLEYFGDHYLLSAFRNDVINSDATCSNFPILFSQRNVCSYINDYALTMHYEVTKTSYLNKIIIDKTSIEFKYDKKPKKFYPDDLPINQLPLLANPFNRETLEVGSISIRYQNDTIKKFDFSYADLGGSGNTRRFLINLHEMGANDYRFEYYRTEMIPPPLTPDIDYWGYWTGAGYSANNPLVPSLLYNKEGDVFYNDDRREPDTSKCDVSLLKKIIYPTGGYTQFDYEGNTYSKRLERRSSDHFIPQLYDTIGIAGGARIKRIVDSDGIKKFNIREIRYTNNYPESGISSGILLDWPMYCMYYEFQNTKKLHVRSTSLHNNYYPGEKFLGYKEVTEIQPSNGYVNFKFTNFESNPDACDYDSIIIYADYQQGVSNIDAFNSMIVGVKLNDRSFERGIARDVTKFAYVNGSYYPVERNFINGFTDINDNPTKYLVGAYETGAIACSYKIYYYPFLSKQVINTIFDKNQIPLIDTINYSYNENGRLIKETIQQSNGSRQMTTYRYTTDIIDEFREGMYQNCYSLFENCMNNYFNCRKNCARLYDNVEDFENCVSTNCECTRCSRDSYNNLFPSTLDNTIQGINKLYLQNRVKLLETIISKDTNVILGSCYDYGLLGHSFAELHKTYSLELLDPIPQSSFRPLNWSSVSSNLSIDTHYRQRIMVDATDNFGNILQMHEINNEQISYIWGYDHNYPVIKAENIDSVTLKSAVSSAMTFASITAFDEITEPSIISNQKNKWSSFNASLRSNTSLKNVLITTYTYKPLVGITSVTDPNGVIIYYEYDGLGRLNLIRDADNNILKTYEYHYKL
jgi:YD repeat-containing protein